MTDLTQTQHPDVDQAWSAVMQTVESVAKRDRNTDQNFPFRGIDSVLNAVGPALRAHRVFVVPTTVEVVSEERYVTKKGTSMHAVILRVTWTVRGPNQTSFQGVTLGQAADSGDKVIAKAQSVAYRVFLINSLALPTGEPDPDSYSHEREVPVDPMISARQAAYDAAARHVSPGLTADQDRDARLALINNVLAAQGVTMQDASVDQVRHITRILESGDLPQAAGLEAPEWSDLDLARRELWDATERHGTNVSERWAVLDQVLGEFSTDRVAASAEQCRRAAQMLLTGVETPPVAYQEEPPF